MRTRALILIGLLVAGFIILPASTPDAEARGKDTVSSTVADGCPTFKPALDRKPKGIRAHRRPHVRPVRPTRGPSKQVTPTLPPPIPADEVLPANSGTGRRVVYSNSLMRVWAVEADGTVVKTHRVSGKRFIPGPGTYSVFSRSCSTCSIVHPWVCWHYMVRFTHSPSGDNIGLHEIPTECVNGVCWKLQTVEQLGQALSSGCVRQSTPDAIWMWNWAPIGTKVVVLA